MAFTFALAQGQKIGNSLAEPDLIDEASQVIEDCLAQGVKLVLPVDATCVKEVSEGAQQFICKLEEGIPEGLIGVDIGPSTIEIFLQEIQEAKTILWNGPVGVYEILDFAMGSNAIAKAMAEAEAFTLVGGGDCVAAVHDSGYSKGINHLSTGGAASLVLMESRSLPAIEALSSNNTLHS